jgi:serine protease Do
MRHAMRYLRALSLLLVPFLAGRAFSISAARGQSEAETLSASFRKASKRVLPAVVTVRVETPPVDILGGERVLPPIATPGSGGSGFVIDSAKGLILTNDHVVASGPRVVVNLPDGRARSAKSVRRDPKSDLALVIVDPEGLQSAEWGDSELLDTGDWVLAVGQPFGLSGTVTAGIVSGKGRGIGVALYEDLIQTDAAIGPGNSGGPLVNLKGQVVGINTAIKTIGGGYEGIGFAVPAARAKRVASDLAEFGYVRRGYLGVGTRPIDPETSTRLKGKSGVLIHSIALRGPAADGGLLVGDVIVEVRGKPVGGVGALQTTIEVAPIGEVLELTVFRAGEEKTVSVRPIAQPDHVGGVETPSRPSPGNATATEPRPAPVAPRNEPDPRAPSRFPELGLRLSEATPELNKRFGYESDITGLIIRGVEPDGPADRGGLEIGMIITDVGMHRVETLGDFRAALTKRPEGRDLVVHIRKGNKAEFRVILEKSIKGAIRSDGR